MKKPSPPKTQIIKEGELPKKSRSFDTGAVRNNADGKADYVASTSWLAIKRYSLFQNNACKKHGYPEDNWRKGIPLKEYEKSLMRHLQQYFVNKYEGGNDEPDIDHLSAAWFNLQGIIHEEEKAKQNG